MAYSAKRAGWVRLGCIRGQGVWNIVSELSRDSVPHGGDNLRSYSSETVISLASVERCYCDSATPSPSPLATAFFISPGVRAALLPESYFLWSRSHSVWLVIVEGWSCVVTNSSRWWNVTRNSCVTLRDNAGPGQCWNKLFSELNQGCKIFARLFKTGQLKTV